MANVAIELGLVDVVQLFHVLVLCGDVKIFEHVCKELKRGAFGRLAIPTF